MQQKWNSWLITVLGEEQAKPGEEWIKKVKYVKVKNVVPDSSWVRLLDYK